MRTRATLNKEMASKHVIGIDLGTTNSCVATLEHGQPNVLTNAEGGRTTPSVVAFLENEERAVGTAARRQAVMNPDNTILSIKRFMGRKLPEVKEEETMVPYSLVSGSYDAVRILARGKEYTPEEISASILSKLKQDAENYFGEEVTDCVVTVPAYFNDAQRQATKDAATISGLNVLRLVNEPTAAALAYGFNQSREEKILVFDLGGGTFDVSVLEIGDGVFEVRATSGDNHLGGDNFDKAIVDFILEEFKKEKNIDLSQDAGALQRLYEAAEKAKIELSTMPTSQISLPFITAIQNEPQHLDKTLTRTQLDDLCANLLERLVEPTKLALQKADLQADDIDHVILVGGMTRMPAVQSKVKTLTGRDAHKGVNPDEAVAIGASIQAGVLKGEVEDVLLLDVTPLTLGLETKGGIMTKLIEANTTLPCRVTDVFTTSEDKQPSVEVHVVQGEREMANANRSLGRVQLLGIPPAPAGVPQIEVTFDLNADGILNVTARDVQTSQQKETQIEASTGLDEEEIEKMRSDAETYREQDKNARANAERKNEAEALRLQASRILLEHNSELLQSEKEKIEAAVENLASLSLEEDEAHSQSKLLEARDKLSQAMQEFSQRIYGGDLGQGDTDIDDDYEHIIDVEDYTAPGNPNSLGDAELKEN